MTTLQRNQRIVELREMFLQLSAIIIEEMEEGKKAETLETFGVMKRIQMELETLEASDNSSLN